ncbi:MAG: ferric iron reductase [bacterium]|nr:ferric iron reductase [bacterium]
MDAVDLSAIHPLTPALQRVTALDENLIADFGTLTEGWFLASELLQPDSQRLADALTRQAANHPHMDARTKGSYFLGEYAWYLPAAAIAAYLAEGRVPDLSLEQVALRWSRYTWHYEGESGEADRLEVRFVSGQFACLPDDAHSQHPNAQIMRDAEALREHLRSALVSHFTPLVEAVYARTNLSRYALWCLVADSFAALFQHLGEGLGDGERARAEAMALIKAAGSPMQTSKTRYFTLEFAGHCETFRARGGCCRYYTVSESGTDYCSTCVLRKPEDRAARLLAYMSKKYAQEPAS